MRITRVVLLAFILTLTLSTSVTTPASEIEEITESPGAEATSAADAAEAGLPPASKPLVLLGTTVHPGTSTRLSWSPSQSFEGIYSATPVLVVNGTKIGPTLCLSAAVHGDELNGVETVRRVMYNLDPAALRGAVIGVPIVNLQGFKRSSRYLSDRRDLNRYFPGDPNGSLASRVAHSFFNEIIVNCSALVDLHTGSFYRTNLPQLRGDLTEPKVVELSRGFGSTVVLHSPAANGTLRGAAMAANIPAVTIEAGAPIVLSQDSVTQSVNAVEGLLHYLDMIDGYSPWGQPESVYHNSTWQRSPAGGMVFSQVELGQQVSKGELLATVTNPITNMETEIRSNTSGRILGMALNQVVQAGFATHHIGIEDTRQTEVGALLPDPPKDVERLSESQQEAEERSPLED